MKIYARQGDLVINRAEAADRLEPVQNYVVAGSHTAPHTILGAAAIRRSGLNLHVTVEADTTLIHTGRHPTIPLPKGSYVINSQRERNGANDQPVND